MVRVIQSLAVAALVTVGPSVVSGGNVPNVRYGPVVKPVAVSVAQVPGLVGPPDQIIPNVVPQVS